MRVRDRRAAGGRAAAVHPARRPRGARLEAYAIEAATLLKADRNAAISRRLEVATLVDAPRAFDPLGRDGQTRPLPRRCAVRGAAAAELRQPAALSTIRFFAVGDVLRRRHRAHPSRCELRNPRQLADWKDRIVPGTWSLQLIARCRLHAHRSAGCARDRGRVDRRYRRAHGVHGARQQAVEQHVALVQAAHTPYAFGLSVALAARPGVLVRQIDGFAGAPTSNRSRRWPCRPATWPGRRSGRVRVRSQSRRDRPTSRAAVSKANRNDINGHKRHAMNRASR